MNDKQQDTTPFLLYRADDGKVIAEVILGDETVWASQKTIAAIFETSKQSISYHLTNIFREAELQEERVVKEILTTADDGKKYNTRFYNLDAIISVGYRISSHRATQFRQWATKVLKEYTIKGFVLNDEQLKQGNASFGKDYFDELLERIREIRASERMFYAKITDIYAQCSVDYDKDSPITQSFYATVQNKLHWAIHGHTAAELVKLRANADKPNMGLTSWKNANNGGKILKSDVIVAKNYLTEEELKGLNRIVNMYLDYAENMAHRHITLKMSDWVQKLDAFLQFNEYQLLQDAGNVSHELARKLAEQEFDKFRVVQDVEYKSDFDKLIEESEKLDVTTKMKGEK